MADVRIKQQAPAGSDRSFGAYTPPLKSRISLTNYWHLCQKWLPKVLPVNHCVLQSPGDRIRYQFIRGPTCSLATSRGSSYMTHAANYSQSRRTARRPLHIQKVEGPVRRSNMGSTVNVSLCGVFCNMILPQRIKINTVGINHSIKFVKYSVMIE